MLQAAAAEHNSKCLRLTTDVKTAVERAQVAEQDLAVLRSGVRAEVDNAKVNEEKIARLVERVALANTKTKIARQECQEAKTKAASKDKAIAAQTAALNDLGHQVRALRSTAAMAENEAASLREAAQLVKFFEEEQERVAEVHAKEMAEMRRDVQIMKEQANELDKSAVEAAFRHAAVVERKNMELQALKAHKIKVEAEQAIAGTASIAAQAKAKKKLQQAEEETAMLFKACSEVAAENRLGCNLHMQATERQHAKEIVTQSAAAQESEKMRWAMVKQKLQLEVEKLEKIVMEQKKELVTRAAYWITVATQMEETKAELSKAHAKNKKSMKTEYESKLALEAAASTKITLQDRLESLVVELAEEKERVQISANSFSASADKNNELTKTLMAERSEFTLEREQLRKEQAALKETIAGLRKEIEMNRNVVVESSATAELNVVLQKQLEESKTRFEGKAAELAAAEERCLELRKENAKLIGHTNHKQKIQLHMQLKVRRKICSVFSLQTHETFFFALPTQNENNALRKREFELLAKNKVLQNRVLVEHQKRLLPLGKVGKFEKTYKKEGNVRKENTDPAQKDNAHARVCLQKLKLANCRSF